MPPITVPLHAPELARGVWIQGPSVSLAFSRGAVVLVDFWESTCINCLRTLPYLSAWHERYAARGLVVVGVHTPEFDFSGSAEIVAAAVRDEGVPYPVLLDRDKETWRLFANRYWPAKYLVDARGYLRYEHFGEGAYGECESWIQRLLREAGDTAPFPEPLAPLRAEDSPGAVCYPATPELYLGFHRGRLLAAEGYRPGEEVRHARRTEAPPAGMFAARGLWLHEAEYLESREAGAEIELTAESASIHLVAGTAGEAEVELDGRPVPTEERGEDVFERGERGEPGERGGRTFARWERGRMVRLIGGGRFRNRHLVLRFPGAGVRIYALSFTSCVRPA